MERTRVYITQKDTTQPLLFLIETYFGTPDLRNTLFLEHIPHDFGYHSFVFVDAPEDAEYFLYPHPVLPGKDRTPFLHKAKRSANAHRKPLLVFAGGDLAYRMHIDDVVLLKGSSYKYQLQPNEIIMPHWVEDLGTRYPPSIHKKSKHPIVGFCGWVAPSGIVARTSYLLKNTALDLIALIPGMRHLIVRKKGLWWRKYSLDALKGASDIDTRFIERDTFSGSAKTISLSPAQARTEYIQNLIESDLVLTPKGDANISLRFFEALSLGRIPVLIDTEVVLPLENVLPYNTCIIRVPYQDVDTLAPILSRFYGDLTEESFANMQRSAREVFHRYLRYDSFFNYLFQSSLLQSAAICARRNASRHTIHLNQ